MRLLHPTEETTVTGAGLVDQPLAMGTQELNKHLQLVVDPARNTATLVTPLGTKAVKMPAEVMSLTVRLLTVLG